jgi:hypothetical protein
VIPELKKIGIRYQQRNQNQNTELGINLGIFNTQSSQVLPSQTGQKLSKTGHIKAKPGKYTFIKEKNRAKSSKPGICPETG